MAGAGLRARHDGQFPADVAGPLLGWLGQTKGTQIDVLVAGWHVGGRPGERPQRPRDCRFDGEILTVSFEPTGVLTVVRPTGGVGSAPAG